MFIGVSLFVSRIMRNLLQQFLQNAVERWHMGRGRNIDGNPCHVA